MENLKTLLLDEKSSIAYINDRVNKFIGSEKDYLDYSNKLKLTFVTLNLLKKSSELLHSVKYDDFISQVTEKINEMEKERETLSKEYGIHLKQNDEIISILCDNNSHKISNIRGKIQEYLIMYDEIIEKLVGERESLSVEQQISIEKNNVS